MRYMTNHIEWLQSITDESGRAIAQRAGLSPATLNRQIKREEFTAESVIAIARAYGHSPVQALAKTCFITATEASGLTKSEIADLLDDRDLIALLATRIKVGEPTWDQPLDKAIDNSNVTELRSNTGDDDVAPGLYAANRRKLEPEEGDDGYGDGA